MIAVRHHPCSCRAEQMLWCSSVQPQFAPGLSPTKCLNLSADRDANGGLLMEPGSTADSGDADSADEASSSTESCTSSIEGSREASPTDSMDGYSAFSSQKAHSMQGSDSDSESDGYGADGLGRQDPTELPDPDMPDDKRQELEVADRASRGQLVGTVELSFSPSTRTRSLTLSPPDVSYILSCARTAEPIGSSADYKIVAGGKRGVLQ